MFYEEKNPDQFLRFGDIIQGFQYLKPVFQDFINNPKDFNIEIANTDYFVILTPCCSIEDKRISITPLRQINLAYPKLFLNSNFTDDFTVINRVMKPEKQIPPEFWEKQPEENKQAKIGEGISYFLHNIFIYCGHDLLPEYNFQYKGNDYQSNYYLIDIKESFSIQSSIIQREANISKYLQLSIQTRSELREKLSHFYYRVPEEDKVS